jgi:hypothetical protein
VVRKDHYMPGRSLFSVLVCALIALGISSPAVAAEEHPEWGSTSAPDAVLKKGCQGYTYSYELTPPEGYWSLELFFKGPNGKRVGSAYFLYGADPLSDTETLRLCRRTTKPGRFTIKALLSVENGSQSEEGWLPESTFRLRAPHRHHS